MTTRKTLQIPPCPQSRKELVEVLTRFAVVRKPRSRAKIERQLVAFEMHVLHGATVRQIAAALGVSKNTVLTDLYHEGRLRAEQLKGLSFTDYLREQSQPRLVIPKATVVALFTAWGPKWVAALLTPEARQALRRCLLDE